ncbi:MAG: Dihydroorotate dehydrogenase (NAD(+)), electron transfer subunit [Candidatus Bipolaricaulis sibiricus]|uniref:Dihydroorotate dehydrogenase (NAD(+)), electron transfer subunit n=1 Tax=Bipolaricaulis sibiricus TaxID=2501609 RepID=A0A410FSA7_BIPS1|nr:MAG: Dihydroorotate dehydrogenase (NAD(+)), electron transfer subunit [Candidatus Bipolaricaulis sibiricus]
MTVACAPVMENAEVAPGVFLLRVRGQFWAEPGQFFMLRAWERDPLLARPMSVFDLSSEAVAFAYAVRGRGTALLARLRPEDPVQLWGPLGQGWRRVPGRVALVGGGMGLAPLLWTAKQFGRPLDVYLGFRQRPWMVEMFQPVADHLYVTSEAGVPSCIQGLVTEAFSPEGYTALYACGPRPMLVELHRMCQRAGVTLYVSLEERMACGIGACLGCTVWTRSGPKRVCRDGPVFPSGEVFVDALP